MHPPTVGRLRIADVNAAVRKKSVYEASERFFENSLVTTLMKPPKNRMKAEIEVLYSIALTREYFMAFNREHGEQSLKELLRACYYEYVPKNSVVFEVDSNGTEFYIILNGTVEFYTKGDPKSTETKQVLEDIKNDKAVVEIKSGNRLRSTYEGLPKVKELQKTKILQTSAGKTILYDGRLPLTAGIPMIRSSYQGKAGGSFGNLALEGGKKGQMRQATVSTMEDCHFAVLDRASFDVDSSL